MAHVVIPRCQSSSTSGSVFGGGSGDGGGGGPPKRPGASKPGREHEQEQDQHPSKCLDLCMTIVLLTNNACRSNQGYSRCSGQDGQQNQRRACKSSG